MPLWHIIQSKQDDTSYMSAKGLTNIGVQDDIPSPTFHCFFSIAPVPFLLISHSLSTIHLVSLYKFNFFWFICFSF